MTMREEAQGAKSRIIQNGPESGGSSLDNSGTFWVFSSAVRLLDFVVANPNVAVPPPLAATYIAMDTELDDGEAEGEEEVEVTETTD